MNIDKPNLTDKRQKIVDAAVSLFRRTHNVKRVSLETIAREAGVSPTTIYNNFGTREALLYEVIKVLTEENLERNRKLVRSAIPFPQKLTGIIGGKMDMASTLNGEVINKLLSQDEKIALFVDRLYEKEIKPLWHEILSQGKQEGYIDESLDEEALSIFLDVLIAGFRAKPDVLQNYNNNMGLIEQLTRIMFYGFLKKDIKLFKKKDG